VRVAFHIEVDKCAALPGMAQNGEQLRHEMGNGIGRIGWTNLRIERGNFDRDIYNGKQV
jgi:hypothetical protein